MFFYVNFVKKDRFFYMYIENINLIFLFIKMKICKLNRIVMSLFCGY